MPVYLDRPLAAIVGYFIATIDDRHPANVC